MNSGYSWRNGLLIILGLLVIGWLDVRFEWLNLGAEASVYEGRPLMAQIETAQTAADQAAPLHVKPIQVTTTTDAGVGSLRWAIAQANESPDDDLLDLGEIEGTVALQSPLPSLTSSLTMRGNGRLTISGESRHRILQIDGGDVTIQGVTFANGLAQGEDGAGGGGGSAGMGGGLLVNGGVVHLVHVQFLNNQAVGGRGSQRLAPHIEIQSQGITQLKVNRGAIAGVNGVSLPGAPAESRPQIDIRWGKTKLKANRGAIAGVNGIGINGIGSIVFGGGGGFGGFANGGNGGNGGNGADGGNGGSGGDGGDGGTGIFGGFGAGGSGSSAGAIAFGGGGGFGGYGNAGNGGNGGIGTIEVAAGGSGGNGGSGGFGGGGGAGGFGGSGGAGDNSGLPGRGGLFGGNGFLGVGGGGAGLGGAVFVRSGSLILNHVHFEGNLALAGLGHRSGRGKGGALFVMSDRPTSAVFPPRVLVLGAPPTYVDNAASNALDLEGDNPDVYGAVSHL